ncbi:MAG: hypothetical protein ACYS6W_08160 [Planctomycetota bacterium]|jgi:type II secretory pathway pseudopilin PulG
MTVIVITAIAVVAMINFKDWVNRSEAMRAMEELRQRVKQYREGHGSVPSGTWVDSQRENLPGNVRLGNLQYRARWITFESTPDEILAYTEKNYNSLLVGKGYIVLRLGAVLSDKGRVEWMGKQEFETLLAQQQSPEEVEML